MEGGRKGGREREREGEGGGGEREKEKRGVGRGSGMHYQLGRMHLLLLLPYTDSPSLPPCYKTLPFLPGNCSGILV